MKRRNRPLRVSHLVHSLAVGGMENGVVNLCNRLGSEQFSPSICTLQRGGVLEQRVARDRVKLFEARRHFGNDPTVPLRLAWELWNRGVDVLHTHCWVTLVEGMLAAMLARVPVVIHSEHGFPLEERRRNVYVQSRLWPRTAAVTAVSATLANRMAEVVRYPRDRIVVVSNGVDTERFRCTDTPSNLRQELRIPATDILVGVVARFVPVKNHTGILNAIARPECQQCQLVIVGDGPLRQTLEDLANQLEVRQRVHFLGELTGVERILGGIDIFVLNSLNEGMSNTILEAMACGVPVIATSVGENPRVVLDGETGILIRPNDSESLAAALKTLGGRPDLRARMGAAGRVRIEQQFSIQTMVDQYSELYKRCSAPHGNNNEGAALASP